MCPDERRSGRTALLATEELIHAQKIEAIGRLIGGVAHDFNNLLTVIMTETELLRFHAAGMPELRDGLDEIQGAAHRAAALTRHLRDASRKQPADATLF